MEKAAGFLLQSKDHETENIREWLDECVSNVVRGILVRQRPLSSKEDFRFVENS